MNLKDYLAGLASEEARAEFASRCATTPGQLRQVAYGARRAGEALAINIERESKRAVACEELRPDVDWAYLRSSSKRKAKKAAN